MQLIVSNSTVQVVNVQDKNADELLTLVMYYHNDIEAELANLFYQLKVAKRMGDKQKWHATQATIEKVKASEHNYLYKNGVFPTGLLNMAIEALKSINAYFEIKDTRIPASEECILRWYNKPFDPRYYQAEAIAAAVIAGRGVIESAVGSGKSLMMAYIIKHFSVKSLIVVPSTGLSAQLYADFSSWFGPGNVKLLDAGKIRKSGKAAPINIVTIQSLASLSKTGDFKEFAKEINALYVDELHHAGSSSYTNLLEDLEHVYYRFGFTGTFLRNDSKTLDMWSFLSNVLYKYTANQAIKDGFLTPIEVRTFALQGKAHKNYQKEYDNCYSNNPELLSRISDICSWHEGGQILILVKKKDKCGLIIHEYLKALGIENSYISGDNSKDEITQTIVAFNEKQIKVLVGSSVISEGIDIRSTDVLINCKGGKSIIDLVQSMGRLIRKFEGKLLGYYYDFNFEKTNYMGEHYKHRMEAVADNFSPTNVHQL